MIFVTLGTQAFPFDRLLRALDQLPGEEELVIQCARSSFRPARATWYDDLPYEQLVELCRSARVIVSHAGVGSILTALRVGRRPVVVARLRAYGEAVDDHQVEFARRLAAADLVTLVESLDDLRSAIAAEGALEQRAVPSRSELVTDLGAYLAQVIQG